MDQPQDFQDHGELARHVYGIDGTAADAQDVPHPFTPDLEMGISTCVACGTGLFNDVHGPESAE